MESLLGTIIAGLFWNCVWGLLGHLLGKRNGRGTEGAVLSFLFGPVGLIITLFLPRARTCPFCGKAIVKRAIRCVHCRKRLPPQTPTAT